MFPGAAGTATGPLAAIVNIFIFNGVEATAMGNREDTWKKQQQHMDERFVSSGDVRAPDMCQLQLTLSHLSVFYSSFSLQDLGQPAEQSTTNTPQHNEVPPPPSPRGGRGHLDHQTKSKVLTFPPPLSKSTAGVELSMRQSSIMQQLEVCCVDGVMPDPDMMLGGSAHPRTGPTTQLPPDA